MEDVRASNKALIDRSNGNPLDKLREEIENGNLVLCRCTLDCQPDYENLLEWIDMYYTLTTKGEAN